jgi:hypothetical protein
MNNDTTYGALGHYFFAPILVAISTVPVVGRGIV